ncbi:hypothetical protein [Paenibacillus thalictri]|uniref:Uncharacterized protein n=1 Tax=Paenibacillus thalictri TaxID=2527873 RepID=A0A4Q9DRN0_9BACL|nr:hypothetical protein [Paenibacillus thalictri]TBL77419.1 hypothetical protein EYB31_18285 [Paenibacillus thalictri]
MSILRLAWNDGSFIREGIYEAFIDQVYVDKAVRVENNLCDQVVVIYKVAVGQGVRSIRERYFLPYYPSSRFAAVLNSLYGYLPEQLDTSDLLDCECFIRICHKPLPSGKTWCYVDEVLPIAEPQ